jgi:cation:H+ antiporter
MTVPQSFFLVHFPVLAVVLSIFAYFVYNEKKRAITRKEGIFLIVLYFLYLAGNAISTF